MGITVRAHDALVISVISCSEWQSDPIVLWIVMRCPKISIHFVRSEVDIRWMNCVNYRVIWVITGSRMIRSDNQNTLWDGNTNDQIYRICGLNLNTVS